MRATLLRGASAVAFALAAGSASAQTLGASPGVPVGGPVDGNTVGTRSLAARISGVLPIQTYGGAGDFNGTSGTDNLAALNSALSAFPGICIHFPAGRYYFSATPPAITNQSVCISGDGPEATVLIFGPSATNGLVANEDNYSHNVVLSDLTIATQGNETGAAVVASWSDADASANSNEHRFTLRNVVVRGETNQSHGWARGLFLTNAQDLSIDSYWFIGRQTNNAASMADTLYASDGIYETNGAYDIVQGHISKVHVYNAQNGIHAYSASVMEGLNVSQVDLVGVNRGVFYDVAGDGPGLVVDGGHVNAYVCGVCGMHATDSIISNMLVYKIPTTTVNTSCVDLLNSNYPNIHNLTCKNQTTDANTSGQYYGIRLNDSNYGMLNANTFFAPSAGVAISKYAANVFTAFSYSGGQVNATTTSAHNLAVGVYVQVTGMAPAAYNGMYLTIAGTTGSTLVMTPVDVPATNPGTATTLGQLSTTGLGANATGNIGRGNTTLGVFTNGNTVAVADTSGNANYIGGGEFYQSTTNAGTVTVTTAGTPVAASPVTGSMQVFAGERYRVSANMAFNGGATAGDALLFVKLGTGTATITFDANAISLAARGPVAANASIGLVVGGTMTITGSGTLQLYAYGQTTGSNSTVAAGGAQISLERL